ncbi:energy-coupling factor transporter transmembrane protein EcfT [Streptosporangium sp. NBC_01755]|uniref:energy-coupling factor transporter transmembrane component T family protein n=1 Tax=unclassified Streptosporangium TaxID=2632669 RepID=UPI002DDBC168|nr:MULTISPECIES: energy-coupling factor transporter transmembrane component T [unclassified Streptosporangium]WSA29331.1 energy-coupling factor transporter transmembrane protein EcfT [Streptosporangium sp. NBC_01810]WSC99227.1 energy-coupling factor transporter transmembrane protein EcfT [Streptosporangium sp. NBC_01755]
MVGGWYEPGSSPLHRTPAGWKFLVLLGLAAVVFVLRSPAWLGGICAVMVLGYMLARVSPGRCLRLARTLGLLVAFMFALQWWLLGLDAAVLVCLRIVAALTAANLFTITTRVDDVVSAVERGLRPLRRFGVRPDRVGLLVGLTLQSVAALSKIAAEVREAAKARGAQRSVTAFAVPFLVRTLRHADELGEALAARGEGDR